MVHSGVLIPKYSIEDINAENFENIALEVFRYQYRANKLYQQFANSLSRNPVTVSCMEQIPFLPASFFKSEKVVSGDWDEVAYIFESSGTTGEIPAKHYVHDATIYERSVLRGFSAFYGDVKQYAIVALLPSYLERKNASLVQMAKLLMEKSGYPMCGFYLNDLEQLYQVICELERKKQKTILLGVTFALIDFANAYPMKLEHVIVIETGGMKGRKEEWTRQQVHELLKSQWKLSSVHSEFGMTELLSQAYSKADGVFSSASTMRVLVRDINDPLEVSKEGRGCLNIIDLVNIHSCSFIATDDMGTVMNDGTFRVEGRIDYSALRGCSLMTAH